jgi:hypothetical protein
MQKLPADEILAGLLSDAAKHALVPSGDEAAVVLSPAEFAHLEAPDRIRREAKARLRQTVSAAQAEAADKGLIEEELERLLADES